MKYISPTAWHWKITPVQIDRIRANDRETINRVYMDNLPVFRRMAGKYCRHIRQPEFFEDCIQQIYVDLPNYNFDNSMRLYWSIRHSFFRASLCNRVSCLSLDAPFSDDDSQTLADCIGVNGFAELEEKEHARNVLMIIAEQTQLTEYQRDQLTALAFGCAAYRGIYAEEYKQAYTA